MKCVNELVITSYTLQVTKKKKKFLELVNTYLDTVLNPESVFPIVVTILQA